MIKKFFLFSLFFVLLLLSPVSPADPKIDLNSLWLCRPDKCALFIKTTEDEKIRVYEVPLEIEKQIFKKLFQETYKCT